MVVVVAFLRADGGPPELMIGDGDDGRRALFLSVDEKVELVEAKSRRGSI